MKTIIPKDTRYMPFTHQKVSCVAASISVIMYKLGIPLLPQELLGYHLGLIVSEENKNLFWNPRTGKRPEAGYGAQIYLKRYEPNTVFKKLKIPLKFTRHTIDKFNTKKDFISFVTDCVQNDRHILARFNHGEFTNNEKSGAHTCVVDRIYASKNIIRLIDSSPNQPKWREVEIDKLIKSMREHPVQGGGFSELEKI